MLGCARIAHRIQNAGIVAALTYGLPFDPSNIKLVGDTKDGMEISLNLCEYSRHFLAYFFPSLKPLLMINVTAAELALRDLEIYNSRVHQIEQF